MGLASLILGDANPFAQYVAQNKNTLHGAFAGFGQAPGIGNGFAAAANGAVQGQQADDAYATAQKAEADRQKQLNQTIQFLQQKYPDLAQEVANGMSIGDAYNEANRRSTPGYGDPSYGKPPIDPTNTYQGRVDAGTAQGLTGTDLSTYALTGKLPGGNQTTRAGVGQPIYGRNKKTQAVEPWQSMTDGTMVNIANPNASPADYDFNPGIAASDRTNATVDAKSSAAARAALPGAQQAFDLANKAADSLLNDTSGMADQFGNTLGFPNQWMPMARAGSDMARFRSELEQGQGNAFLQARQVLKGAGQVTDYEGAKAEAAYSRMELAAKNNNQQEFVAAVQEFKQAVNEGYQKLQAAAQGDYAQGGSGIAAGGPSVQSLLDKYK